MSNSKNLSAPPFHRSTPYTLLALLLATCLFLLTACGKEPPVFQGSDISGTHLGHDLDMVDHHGHSRTLASYKGKVTVVFFGFTQCPDVCPTSLAQLAQAMELLADKAKDVQVLMVTVDPDRDTATILENYVTAFHPDFIGLTGSADQLARTAKSFRAFYVKVPGRTPDDYTMDHGSSFYILDQSGEARVLLPGQAPASALASDIRQLLD